MRIVRISQQMGKPSIFSTKLYNNFMELKNSKLTWKSSEFREAAKLTIKSHGFLAAVDASAPYMFLLQTNLHDFVVENGETQYQYANIRLLANTSRSYQGGKDEIVATWSLNSNDEIRQFVRNLFDEIGIKDIVLPHERKTKVINGREAINSIRLSRPKTHLEPATTLELFVSVSNKRFVLFMNSSTPETGQNTENIIKEFEQISDAIKEMNALAQRAKQQRGFVSEGRIGYIPEWATPENWDFFLNIPKRADEPEESTPQNIIAPKPIAIPKPPSQKTNLEEMDIPEMDILGSKKSFLKLGEDYGGYFTGNLPQTTSPGAGANFSQIQSSFSKAPLAIELAKNFDSQQFGGRLMKNISFVFDFSKGGAFGVFIPALAQAGETQALKAELEKMGYVVQPDEEGLLKAYAPKGQHKEMEEIKKDIEQTYSRLKMSLGKPIGINVRDNINEAMKNARDINQKIEGTMIGNSPTGNQSPTNQNLWEWIAALNVGATIIHEAIHASGEMEEGVPEAGQAAFEGWALPIINDKFRQDMEGKGQGEFFSPIVLTNQKTHAKNIGWYKKAQFSYGEPIGSDLKGRFPNGPQADSGMADWGMIAQDIQDTPIEKRLGRQYMSPIPQDLSQEHDIVEKQLRKMTRGIEPLDAKDSTEALLREDHTNDATSYQLLEKTMEELRPSPLMIPLKASASLNKMATLFGWMNNLEISDGSTIPGLSDRVMAWEDRDEDFSEEEDWIKKQPRYNPTYDIKGFYYRWIEPRFRPTLFQDITQDYSGSSPAKRFAAVKVKDVDSDLYKILRVMNIAKSKVESGDVLSTRLILTEDLLPLANHLFESVNSVKVIAMKYGKTEAGDIIYSFWVSSPKIEDGDIRKIESYLQNKNKDSEIEVLVEKLLKIKEKKRAVVNTLLSELKGICAKQNVDYSKRKIGILDNGEIDIKIEGAISEHLMKIGSLLAEALRVQNVIMDPSINRVVFVYKGFLICIEN